MSNTQDLLPVLNTTNLQKDNNRLYQVIKDLIGNLLSNEKAVAVIAGSSGSSSIINNITQQFLNFTGDSGSDDGLVIPGPIGPQGPTGSTGSAGTNTFLVTENFNDEINFIPGSLSGSSADYVVMSDGATPTPSPVDDGTGNFVYILYTP